MRKSPPRLSLASQLKVAGRVREAFLQHGYARMTMVTLASACGLTRRALYYYFNSKDEAFRAMISLDNSEALQRGDLAAQSVLKGKNPTALEAITSWIDARYGGTRRRLSESAFAKEINDTAFAVAGDVMNEYALITHADIAKLLHQLQKLGLLVLNRGTSRELVARLLADGARGVNQTRPPIPEAELASRYREMSSAILYGSAQKR